MTTMDEEYYWMDIASATEMGKYLTRKESKFIDVCLSNLNSKSSCCILDIGAGSGRFSIPLHKRGFYTVALEINLVPLKKLRRKENNVPVIHANAYNCPIRNNTFDLVMAIEVIDPENLFLKEARRVLKNGGGLIIAFANTRSYKYYLRRVIRRKEQDEFYKLNIKDVTKSLNENGFIIKKVWGFNWLPFTRTSNNKLINLFSGVEEILGLESISSLSPWVFVCAEKEWVCEGR